MAAIKIKYPDIVTSADGEYYFNGVVINRVGNKYYRDGKEIEILEVPEDVTDPFYILNEDIKEVADFDNHNSDSDNGFRDDTDNNFTEEELKQASEGLPDDIDEGYKESSDTTEDNIDDNTKENKKENTKDSNDETSFKGIKLHGYIRFYDKVEEGDKYEVTCKEIDRICREAKKALKKKAISKQLKSISLDDATSDEMKMLSEMIERSKTSNKKK